MVSAAMCRIARIVDMSTAQPVEASRLRALEFPAIRDLPLFRTMSDANFRIVTRAGYDQTFPRHVQLIDEGGTPDFLYIVVAGSVELFATWEGRETTLAVVEPVSSFILAACIRDAPNLMSARTLQNTRIVLLPSSDLREVFHVDADFAEAVINELASCYRGAVRHTKDLKLRTARERLAAYILRQSEQVDSGATFRLPIEKQLLASYLGITPESLSRTLKSLRGSGVVVDGQRIIITNRAALSTLAHPSNLIDGSDT